MIFISKALGIIQETPSNKEGEESRGLIAACNVMEPLHQPANQLRSFIGNKVINTQSNHSMKEEGIYQSAV